jgi:hypothetical protein
MPAAIIYSVKFYIRQRHQGFTNDIADFNRAENRG